MSKLIHTLTAPLSKLLLASACALGLSMTATAAPDMCNVYCAIAHAGLLI